MTISSGHSALRIGRFSEAGRIHLVTAVVWNRAPLFRDHVTARMAARAIHSPTTWLNAECLAWVLMPDHWHGIIQLGEDADLSKTIGKMKSRVTRALRKTGRESPVWQRAFHDRALRKEDDLKAMARYVVANPIRAGLVRRVGDYPYWDAIWVGS
ncbi:MAG: transposase [Luteibacter sp.]|uniref:REP-associated tyrosine transposase n=1 Tax=Luteibacter sp. TaxID=1886636 RepID=UPI0028075FC0|nr:transposase [Luteibacter sp.]MDQ7996226.1 transposase [Luteibacter sp.]MDQ8049523.1 transposase [Luteibacter sp.]